jgi:phosphate transport system substrate-binding protein
LNSEDLFMKNIIGIVSLALLAGACGNSADNEAQAASNLTGTVAIDGSSTVFPITEAVAEEFRAVEPGVRVTVGVSGTGGGFKKFTAGETDISDASRYIKGKEQTGCAAAARDYIELPVAYDGLAVVVHKDNTFASSMTIAELRAMWAADSASKKWSDIRADWPDREFNLYAPGQDSGTFDYFTDTINGESGNCRPDATFSEDDNVLVRGVAGDPDGMAFFGLAYYVENQDKLGVVAIDGGNGPVIPSLETVEGGTYTPLSRPLFIYVSKKAAERPEVDAFVRFYLTSARELSGEVGYVPFPENIYEGLLKRYTTRVLGTEVGKEGTIEALYL